MSATPENPLITFVIFAYNQERFIREAVEGAFSQTYSPLEIILSDDCSSDRTFEIIEEMALSYTGPHRIVINRNSSNLRVIEHVNRLMQLAKAELLVLAAGDDISMPNRCEEVHARFIEGGLKTVAIFSNAVIIDEHSGEKGIYFKRLPIYSRTLEDFKATKRCWTLGCSVAIRKVIYRKYGDMNTNVLQEDGVMAFRSLLEGDIEFINTPLVKYRQHGSNVSQTENPGKLVKLERKQYLMKQSWLKDVITLNCGDTSLVTIVRVEYWRSLIRSGFFMLPILGWVYYYSLFKMIKMVRFVRSLKKTYLARCSERNDTPITSYTGTIKNILDKNKSRQKN